MHGLDISVRQRLAQQRREPSQRGRVGRIASQGAAVVRLGVGQLAQFLVEDADVEVGGGEVGLELDGRGVVCAGLVMTAGVLEDPRQRVVRDRLLGVELQDPLATRLDLVMERERSGRLGEVAEELDRAGLQLDGPAQPLERLAPGIPADRRQAESGRGPGPAGVALVRQVERRLGLGRPAQGEQDVAEVQVRLDQGRFERHGGLTVRQGLVGSSLLQQQLAEVGPGLWQPGIDRDRAAEVRQRLLAITEGEDRDAAVDVRRGVVRVQGECPGEGLGGLGRPAQGLPGQSEAGMIGRDVGANRQGTLDPLDGLLGPSLVMMDDAQEAGRVGVRGIPRQGRLVVPGRTGQVARAMQP